MAFKTAQEIIDHMKELLEENKGTLGLNSVLVSGQDELIFEYPAVVLTDGDVDRIIHGTQQFLEIVEVNFWVYHADLNVDRAKRNKEDRELATKITQKLHEDYTLGGNIVHGFVRRESPGVLVRKTQPVVATMLVWSGQMRTPMREV